MILRDKHLKFNVLIWLLFSIPLGISLYLIVDRYQYRAFLLREGVVGYGTFKQVPGSSEEYAIFLNDGREILSVYSKNLKDLKPGMQYQFIYVSLGKMVVSVEYYPLDRNFIFKDIWIYLVGIALLTLVAFFVLAKLL
jgi:hypothetical protein